MQVHTKFKQILVIDFPLCVSIIAAILVLVAGPDKDASPGI